MVKTTYLLLQLP